MVEAGIVAVCRALGRRRAALFSPLDASKALGLSVDALLAIERGEGSISDADRLVGLLGASVPLPKGRAVRGRSLGPLPPGCCPSCFRKVGKVRGCGCGVCPGVGGK